MHLIQILTIISLVVLFICFFIIWLFKRPSVKGKCGEAAVNLMLKSLNSDEYHIFNDIILPDKSGGTTQIDHIVFSRYGIFVIETKNLNMNGDIYGDLYSAQWCQSFHSKKYQIKNPFQQNFKHIKYLSETTCLPIECFENIVIILGANDIKIRDHHPKNLVKNYHELIDCIKSFTEIRLNDSILSNAEQLLQENFLENTRANHQKHVEHVKKIVTDKSKNPVICPQCGSEMILREAKNGSFAGNKFWGCSRYPECKCKINTYSKDNFNGNNTPETLPPPPTGAIQCPECGSKMIIREAKNGSFAGNKFWGCSRYPECKCKINIYKDTYTGNTAKEPVLTSSTGAIQCPECGSRMIIRKAKNGSFAGNKFWGCSRYPECKCKINISKEQP